MNINKNISIWRGDSTPPTNYHFWIKSNGQQFTFNGEKWVNYVEDIPTASLESKGLMSSQDKVNLEECVQHLEDTSNPHHVSKEQIGLGNVTNDAQVKRSELGVTVATLNDNGKVAESQLPSYVDDILEGQLVSVTEFTLNAGQHGEVKQSGVIYLDTTTNTSYRWSGSQYVMTGSSLTLGEGEDQAFPGNRGVNLENQSAVTSLLSEASEDKVTIKVTQKSLDGKSESTDDVDIRVATTTTAGVMSATDKAALDELPNLISEAEISSISNTQTANDVTIETHSANQRLTTTIPYATSTTAGVMSAEDKVEVNKIKDKADKVELKAVSDKVDTIIVPTKVSELTNDLAFQTKTEVNTAIQKVVGAAPEALDTLEEIATKLSDNDDAVAGIVNTLSDKANVGDSYTKTESDAKYLTTGAASDTYLPKATYTASDILTKIKTVDGTGSGLDADTVDGYQASDFMKSVGSVSTAEVAMNADEIPLNSVQHDYRWSNAPYNTAISSILDLSYSPDWRTQLFTYHSRQPALYTRSRYSGTTWGDWRQLAFTDSNVASATKLATPHTIWGQSFDGTANVSGSLSGVEDINMKGTIYNVRYLKHAGIPDGVGALSPALGIGPSPDNYGLFLWGRNNGQGYIQVGRKDGTQMAYDLILQNFGGNVGIGTETPSERLDVNGNVKAAQFIKTDGTASQFLKADGSVDSNSYLLSSAYTAADILTKIKTVDGAGSGLDADTLDGVHGKSYVYYNAYNFSNGCLVRLKLLTSENYMVTVHIRGNSYNALRPIDTWVQFYNYNSSVSGAYMIIAQGAIHNGYDFGNINVFGYDGHVYLWFKQADVFQSFSVYAECANSPYIGNLVEDITNAAMPQSGVSGLVTIVPMKSALTTDLSNVLKEDVVDGPVLEEIENLTKEELKAELLGDVDSKLVTKVDKVEGKGLSTNDYTNAEKSKLSSLPTSARLDDLLAYKQDIIVNSADIIVDWNDYGDSTLYIEHSAKLKVFDDLWISAAGSNGTVDHTHTESGVSKPYYLNEVWMTYEEALRVYNEYYPDVLSLIGREIYGVTNFPPPNNSSALQYANYTVPNAKVINVGNGFLVGSFSGWLMTAPKLTKIIGDINLHYWNASTKSNQYLKAPALTDVSLYHLCNNFSIEFLKSISLSSMQYMVNNSTATSPITVTVHPYVYAKLTGDTTNINPSTKITREVTVEDQLWSSDWSDEQVGFDLYCENLIFEPFDTIIIPDIINPGTNEPIRGTVDRISDTTHKIIRVILEKAVFDEEGELMFNTVPMGSKIMRVDPETSEEELTQWQALVTTANNKHISFATT